jgi:preprotein translocase subunit YajC
VNGLFIIILLFGLLWFLMIRPQQAKARQQQRMLSDVEPGDEILTVGGIYGIVQELEPAEEGGDLVVEIADGIHVRVARKALATVVKPEDEEDEEEAEAAANGAVDETAKAETDGTAPEGVEEVNDEQETVNPEVAENPAHSERS